jgi:hypothetical protein
MHKLKRLDTDPGYAENRTIRLLRRCLSCLTMFDSEWVGERICRRCKGSAHWRTSLPLPE